MLDGNYIHFNRVDNYTDDKNDSAQPEQEKLMNEKLCFEKDPNFTLRNYYEKCRKRILEIANNSNQIWSLDFMSGKIHNRRFRTLNIIDEHARECLDIKILRSIPSNINC